MNISGNENSEAGLEAPYVSIRSSNGSAHQVTPLPDSIYSRYIYSQYETVLRCESSNESLPLILITGKTASRNTRSPLLDSFVNDGRDNNAFIVKSQLTDLSDLQTGQKTHLTHRLAPPQNVVITARAFAVDRLNRIISSDREDIVAIDEKLVGKQARIAPISDLESLRELKRRLR